MPDTDPGPTVRADDADGPSPVVLDVVPAVAVVIVLALILVVAQGSDQPPDTVAYLFPVGFGAVMLLRRRAPLVVLGLTTLGMFSYYALDYPPIGVAVPLVAALFAAADRGRTGWALVTGALVFAVSFGFRLREGESTSFLLGYEAVTNLALIAAAVALGAASRAHRARAAQHDEIVRLAAEGARRASEARMRSERERISRDLHDSIGHTMSVIALHSGVAREKVGSDPAAAVVALDHIRDASGDALGDLRWIVRVLRDDTGIDRAPVPTVSSIPELAEVTHAAGITVSTSIDCPADVPPPVDAAVFRIVQEALTNVVRHSRAGHATVVITTGETELSVEITDDGRGGAPTGTTGHGLTGMTERARLLGGTLRAGPGADGGFTVHARLPRTLAR